MPYNSAFPEDYASLVGYATIMFALLEWNVGWCAEKIEGSFLISVRGKTSNIIGREAQRVFDAATAIRPAVRGRLLGMCSQYRALTRKRNLLLHGKPCTDPNGEQALMYVEEGKAKYWSRADLHQLIRQFEEASTLANSILHQDLSSSA